MMNKIVNNFNRSTIRVFGIILFSLGIILNVNGQVELKEKYFIPFEYRVLNFSKDQKIEIEKERNKLIACNLTDPEIRKLKNIFFNNLVTKKQKNKLIRRREISIMNLIGRKYKYLRLDSLQTARAFNFYFDQSKSLDKGKKLGRMKKIIFDNLSNEQLVLKEEEDVKNWNRKKSNAINRDSNYVKKAIFQQKKLSIISSYYYPRIVKISKKIKKKLRDEDLKLIEDLQELYFTRLEKVKISKEELSKPREDGKRAMYYGNYYSYMLERMKLKPNLCIFWCGINFGSSDETKEELLVNGLNHIKKKYPKLIAKGLRKKRKLEKKLKRKIEKAKSKEEKKEMTRVTIVPETYIQEVEDIVDLILVKYQEKN